MAWQDRSPHENRPDATTTGTNDREAERLAALDHLGAVRPELDEVLQQLVDSMRDIFGAELALVDLILTDIQYYRAWSGDLPTELAETRQIAREHSMCQYVVEDEAPLVVEDFLASEEFRDQYFCVNYDVRFYASTPLATSDGYTIGSLCLADTQPRKFSEEEMTFLTAFAQAVVGRLEVLGALGREREAKEEIQAFHRTIRSYRGLSRVPLRPLSGPGEILRGRQSDAQLRRRLAHRAHEPVREHLVPDVALWREIFKG